MGAASLQRCSEGRFTLGLGASSPPLVEGFHGVGFQRPVARLRATLTAVRALLEGERMPALAGGARALRLGVALEGGVPIALAALAPASVRLAGELADEWAPFLWALIAPRPRAQELLAEGRARPPRPRGSPWRCRSPSVRTRRPRAGWRRGG